MSEETQERQEETGAERAQETLPEGTAARKPVKKWVRVLSAVLAGVILIAAGFTAGWVGNYFSIDPRIRELEWVLSVLEDEHYQEVDMDAVYEDLYDAAMPDIFSAYYTAEEYAERVAQSQGHNEGIGITLVSETAGSVRVYSVVENSPAQLSGLAAGMYVYGYSEPDGEIFKAATTSEVTAFAREQEGDFVIYAGYDAAAEPSAENAHTMARGAYEAAYVTYRDSGTSFAFRGEEAQLTETGEPLEGLDDKTAYIRLDSFDGNCAQEFRACLERMKERGRTNLILDLRANGGGYMRDLQNIASHLMRENSSVLPVVAYAQFRDGSRRNYIAYGDDFDEYFTEDSVISVLADQNSASASECLIGALIDYGTIGYEDIYIRKAEGAEHWGTYGKGVMQSTFVSDTGSAVQITVARIYWPKGNCIHGRGVTDADGTVGIEAPFLRGETDVFLQQALGMICPQADA